MTGQLNYNVRTKRYEFYPDDGGDEFGLHCGDCLEYYYGSQLYYEDDKWRATRIEYDRMAFDGVGDWYLVGTRLLGADLSGLKVRVEI